jgi:hypothetical protein
MQEKILSINWQNKLGKYLLVVNVSDTDGNVEPYYRYIDAIEFDKIYEQFTNASLDNISQRL